MMVMNWYTTVTDGTVKYSRSLNDITSRAAFAQYLVFIQILRLVLFDACILPSLVIWIWKSKAILVIVLPWNSNTFIALVINHTNCVIVFNTSFFRLLSAKRPTLRLIAHRNYNTRIIHTASTLFFNVSFIFCFWKFIWRHCFLFLTKVFMQKLFVYKELSFIFLLSDNLFVCKWYILEHFTKWICLSRNDTRIS